MSGNEQTSEPEVPMPSKDWWERYKIVSNSISVIFIPVILAIMAWILQTDLKQNDVKVKFVELSVKILEKDPSKSHTGLREWAATILENYSEVPLGEARNELVNQVALPTSVSLIPSYDNNFPSIIQPLLIGLDSNTGLIKATKISEIRLTNEVVSAAQNSNDYESKHISKLPNGSYAFAEQAENILDFKKNNNTNFTVTAHGMLGSYEIHKKKNGTIFLVGYSYFDEIERTKLILYPYKAAYMKNSKLYAIAIPIKDIKTIGSAKRFGAN